MNEGIYTRDKGRSKKKVDRDKSNKKKAHAGKLKNETSQAEAMRKKLRTGKAGISETKEEIKKRKKLQKQGRKKMYADAAVSPKLSTIKYLPRVVRFISSLAITSFT